MSAQNNRNYFLIGAVWGIVCALILTASAFIAYRFFVTPSTIGILKGFVRQARHFSFVKGQVKDFKLGFESETEMSFFTFDGNVGHELSVDHASEGLKSLLVKIPASQEFPGMEWEVFSAKESLDWDGNRIFSFDVFNGGSETVTMTIKIKSGINYPKRSFEKEISLPAQQSTTVKITIGELRAALDIKTITYFKIFINQLTQLTPLYFDNIKLEPNL